MAEYLVTTLSRTGHYGCTHGEWIISEDQESVNSNTAIEYTRTVHVHSFGFNDSERFYNMGRPLGRIKYNPYITNHYHFEVSNKHFVHDANRSYKVFQNNAINPLEHGIMHPPYIDNEEPLIETLRVTKHTASGAGYSSQEVDHVNIEDGDTPPPLIFDASEGASLNLIYEVTDFSTWYKLNGTIGRYPDSGEHNLGVYGVRYRCYYRPNSQSDWQERTDADYKHEIVLNERKLQSLPSASELYWEVERPNGYMGYPYDQQNFCITALDDLTYSNQVPSKEHLFEEGLSFDDLPNGQVKIVFEAWDVDNNIDSHEYFINLTGGCNIAPASIDADVTWSGRWLLQGDLHITDGATLTIEPGSKVFWDDRHSIVLDGRIVAQGEEDSVIEFISRSSSEEDSGGLIISSTFRNDPSVFSNCRFENLGGYEINGVTYGGAIYVDNQDAVAIENCEFINCNADWGGAIYMENSEGRVSNNIITGCVAENGGAISVVCGSLYIVNNQIVGNTAEYGGAVHLTDTDAVLANNTISLNEATDNGSALYMSGTGNGMFNNIIWSNPCPLSSYPIYLGANASPVFEYNDVENGEQSVFEHYSASKTWQNNLSSDPLFCGDYHPYPFQLDDESLCIDAGVSDTTGLHLPALDIIGNARIAPGLLTRVDIGCYEKPVYVTSIDVSGVIDDYQVWGCDTVRVIGDVDITGLGTLVINPGVHVECTGDYGITSHGELIAVGTETDSIRFYSTDSVNPRWKGIRIDSEGIWNNLRANFKHCDFQQAYAAADTIRLGGGAIMLSGFVVCEISHCSFHDNETDGIGGAIAALSVNPLIENCIFYNNQANHGGAISLESSYAFLKSNLIYNNVADSCGGGVHYVCSDPQIVNNTIADNAALYGGGFFSRNSAGKIVNTILYDNSDSVLASYCGQVYILNDSEGDDGWEMGLPELFYSNVAGGAEGIAVTEDLLLTYRGAQGNPSLSGSTRNGRLGDLRDESFTGVFENCFDELPRFTDPANGDYKLFHTSMCINAGAPVDWQTYGVDPINADNLGYSQYDNGYDMGYSEVTEYPACYSLESTINRSLTLRSPTVEVPNSVSVASSAVIICPGTELQFHNNASMVFTDGSKLCAVGAENDSIRFSCAEGNSSWKGLRFTDTDVTMHYTLVEKVFNVVADGSVCIDDTPGVYEKVIVSIENSSFSGCHARNGGAIFIDLIHSISECNISNSEFIDNIADMNGGAIHIGSIGQGCIANNLIHHNSTIDGDGGGVFFATNCPGMSDDARFELRENIIHLYEALDPGQGVDPDQVSEGGGVYVSDQLVMIGNRIDDNTAEAGAGIYALKGPLVSVNNTVYHNDGVGIQFQETGSITKRSHIVNTIVWGNDGSAILWEELVPNLRIGYNPAQELLNAAEYNMELTNYLLARDQLEQVISDYPGSGEAKRAASLLLSLYSSSEFSYSELQQYYLNEPNLHYNEDIAKLADYLLTVCGIKMGDYTSAIAWFEDIIDDPPSEVDSLYAQIDLGYTYLLMEPVARETVGRYPQYRPDSRDSYMSTREEIISQIVHTENLDLPSVPEYSLQMQQNFPNPFNPETTISFTVPQDMHVELAIYNIRGQRVRTLSNTELEKGKHSIVWDGHDSNRQQVASGVYFYQLKAGKKIVTKKMLLMK